MLFLPRRLHALAPILALSSWVQLPAEALSCRTSVENFGVVRVEGLSELVGDLVIECTGGNPTPQGQPLPSVDFDVELNTGISSRILEGDELEALLLVDDPAPAAQVVGKTVFQARSIGGSRMSIPGVLFDPPGPSRKRVLRLRNLRVDASEFDEDDSGVGNIILTLRATGILEGPLGEVVQKVGVTQRSLIFGVGDAAAVTSNNLVRLIRSHDNNRDLLLDPTADFSSPGGRSFTLQFAEQFQKAFRRRVLADVLGHIQDQADPVQAVATESGFFNSSLPAAGGLNRAGLADRGTRLMATFRNVPAGAAVFVTIGPARPGSTRFVDAGLVATRDDDTDLGKETALVSPTSVADHGIAPIAIKNGVGHAVWEITASDINGIDTVSFGVTVAYLRDVPPLGTTSVTGSYAPTSDQQSSSEKAPLPRFSPAGSTQGAFEVSLGDACGVAIQDVVVGGLDDPLKDDVFAFDALSGTLLDLQIKAKAGTRPVEMRLFDPSLAQIDIAAFVISRGRSTTLKRFPLFDTGEYKAVLRSADGSFLDYRLKVHGKLPKGRLKLKSLREVATPGETLVQEIEAVEGSILDVTLKGRGVDPEILQVVEQSQEATLSISIDTHLKRGEKTEKVKGLLLPFTGTYRLVFTGLGGTGTLNLSARIRAPGRRVLEECVE